MLFYHSLLLLDWTRANSLYKVLYFLMLDLCTSALGFQVNGLAWWWCDLHHLGKAWSAQYILESTQELTAHAWTGARRTPPVVDRAEGSTDSSQLRPHERIFIQWEAAFLLCIIGLRRVQFWSNSLGAGWIETDISGGRPNEIIDKTKIYVLWITPVLTRTPLKIE